jgi:replicative DNA helicase
LLPPPIGFLPPQNLQAEQSVLGACMIDKEIVYDVLDMLDSDDFYHDGNKEIFKAIHKASNTIDKVDLITVSEKLRDEGILDHVGGIEYLSHLMSMVPTTSNALNYSKIVLDNSKRRNLITTAQKILKQAFENDEVVDIVDAAEKEILSINERKQTDIPTPQEMAFKALNMLEERSKNKGQVTGLKTGLKDLDDKLMGLQDGDLIIVAARPSMGKTSLAEGIATNAALYKNKTVAFFSQEMSQQQVVDRIYSSHGLIDSETIKLGTLNDTHWERVGKITSALSESKYIIDETPNIRASEIRSKCRRIKKKYGDLGLVVIDHLTEMWRPKKQDPRIEHEENIRACKRIAKEMGCPVILLQQLSRGPEQRQDKRPLLSDLKETGSAEEVADVIMLIYRDEYYYPDTNKKGVAEVITAKNRNGQIGTTEVAWVGKNTAFRNLERYKQGDLCG